MLILLLFKQQASFLGPLPVAVPYSWDDLRPYIHMMIYTTFNKSLPYVTLSVGHIAAILFNIYKTAA